MQRASNPARIGAVPMTVIGFPWLPGAGRKPVASPVAVMVGMVMGKGGECGMKKIAATRG